MDDSHASFSSNDLPESDLDTQGSGPSRSTHMLYTIAIVLLVLWLVGWLGFHLLGGLIHILVVLAVIVFVIAMVKKV